MQPVIPVLFYFMKYIVLICNCKQALSITDNSMQVSKKKKKKKFMLILFFEQVLDGHNGNAAAIYTRDNLLNHVLSAVPRGLSRDEWLHALPRALVAGFVKTDKEFQTKGKIKCICLRTNLYMNL